MTKGRPRAAWGTLELTREILVLLCSNDPGPQTTGFFDKATLILIYDFNSNEGGFLLWTATSS